MKQVYYNKYFVSIVDTDGLVLKHLGISSYIADWLHAHASPDIQGLTHK